MIRPAVPSDTAAVLVLAEAAGLFHTDELDQLRGMLASYHGSVATNELWLVDDDGGLVGIAYVAPERMTEGTWNLYLIAVHPQHQRRGRGAAMLDHVEWQLRRRKGRVLLVETMGIDDFEYVRAFYRTAGFREEARIRDFYQLGHDKIVYWKALTSGAA